MISMITTYRKLCEQILDTYKALLCDPFLRLDDPNFKTLSESKRILEEVKESNKLSAELFSPEEIFTFLRTLLDSYGIASASGSENLTIFDMALIGRRRYRKENMKEDHVRNFYFSKLFQGWWNSEHKLDRIIDLALDSRLKEQPGRLCDYAIPPKDSDIELVECKRIHPHPLTNSSFEDLADKIVDKANNEAGVQFSETEKKLSQEGKRIFCKNFLLDISYYSNLEAKKVYNGFEVSGFAKEEIDQIKSLVLSRNVNKGLLDRIMLCWSQVVYKGELPIAIQQQVVPMLLNDQAKDIINYQGWTVEAYPRREDLCSIVETRVSTCARGLPWIKAGYHSETDSLLKWGREERLSEL
jgi:hypothetical protein